MSTSDELRKLPSVDKMLQDPNVARWVEAYGDDLVVDAVREALSGLREDINEGASYPGGSQAVDRVQACLEAIVQPTLRPIINATGVVLHTNLGRAPLMLRAFSVA